MAQSMWAQTTKSSGGGYDGSGINPGGMYSPASGSVVTPTWEQTPQVATLNPGGGVTIDHQLITGGGTHPVILPPNTGGVYPRPNTGGGDPYTPVNHPRGRQPEWGGPFRRPNFWQQIQQMARPSVSTSAAGQARAQQQQSNAARARAAFLSGFNGVRSPLMQRAVRNNSSVAIPGISFGTF